MIITKAQLIQEGVLSAVSNNWGKGALGVGVIMAAKAGVFGPKAELATNAGLEASQKWLGEAKDKMINEYGTSAEKAVVKAEGVLEKAKSNVPEMSHKEDPLGMKNNDFKLEPNLFDKTQDLQKEIGEI